MSGVKLVDKSTNSLVDVDPAQVNQAIESGKFAFDKKRNYPVINNGTPKWITAEDAGKYRGRLDFTTDDEVKTFNAEQSMRGVLPKLGAAAYGAGTALTLGALPLGIEMLGGEGGKKFVETVERGAPGYVLGGEIAGSLVDPFAAAERIGARLTGRGVAKGAAGAAEAAGAAAAREAAPGFTEAVYEAERGIPALRPGPAAEAPPLRLGGRVAGAEPAAGAGYSAREAAAAAREPRALPPAGREPIAAPESPLTFQAPPFESQVMTDLRLGRINTADRIAELDQTIASTLGSKAKGAKQAVKGLQKERAGLARQLEEYDFQLAKFEPAEAQALGAQAGRAATAAEMKAPTSLMTGEVGAAAPEVKLGERAAAEAEQARQRLRMGGGAPERVGPEAGPLALGRETGLAPTAARESVLEAEFTENAALAPMREAFMEPPMPAAPATDGGFSLGGMGRSAAESGAYGAMRQLGRQQAGLEEGDMGDVLKAGALGAVLPPALGLGAKAAGVAGKAALPGVAAKIGEALEKGAEKLEEASILRAWGISPGQAGKVQRMFYNPEAETLGSRDLSNFIREKLGQVEQLKARPEHANNINLQSIRPDKGLRGMTAEQRYAFANALNDTLNRERTALFEQVGNPALTEQEVAQVFRHGFAKTGTAGKGVVEIKPFVDELANAAARGESLTLETLQRMKTAFGQQMEQVHTTNPWRKEEVAFYDELKKLIQAKVGEASPELLTSLKALDAQSTMAIEIEKGVQKLAQRLSTAQAVGPDLLAQVGLGAFAMNKPLEAIKFGVGAMALRAINLHRGDGIMADLSGGFARKMATNPEAAAQVVTRSVLTSKSPAMTGMVAEHFVDATPQSYSTVSQLVRQLQDQRDLVKADMKSQLASMDPKDAEAIVTSLDAKINALAAEQPKGIPTSDALTQQQKNYVIFARSILDPGYAVQVLLNGQDGTEQAAKALQATPGGQQTLDALQKQFKAALDENTRLRNDQAFITMTRSIQKASGKRGLLLSTIHGTQQAQGGSGQGAAPRLGATGQKAAATSLAGAYKVTGS